MENPDLNLQPGLRGFAKIDGGTHTLAWWLWRLIAKSSTSSFDLTAKRKCRFDDREGHGVITVAVRTSPVSECKFASSCQFDSLDESGRPI